MTALQRRLGRNKARGFRAPSRRLPSTIIHICGLALLAVAPGLALSALIEWYHDDSATVALLVCTVVFSIVGAVMFRSTKIDDLTPRTIFGAVAWSWMLISILGALPFVLARTFQRDGVGRWIEMADAIFESVSGYTCTGSTVLTTLPDFADPDPQVGRGILFYRQLTQWYGGMGFVQLVITVLPTLGTRALGFMGAEAPGPTAERLSPRARDTARLLWIVYAGVTGLIAVAYRLAGMPFFDAIAHAVTTSATGGFSIYNDSIGEYDSIPIELVAQVGMLIGGANFTLHWLFVSRDRGIYRKDPEFRSYIAIAVVATAIVTSMLMVNDSVGGFGPSLRAASFNVVSMATSTGFGNAQGAGTPGDFVRWSASPLVIVLLLMAVGGMSGSTAGGMKVVRIRVLAAASQRLVDTVRQRRAVIPVKINNEVVKEDVVHRIGVFVIAYIVMTVGGLIVVVALGGELEASIGATIGSLSNMGPGLADAGPTSTFLVFPTPARMVLAFLMLAGRLELFAVLLMLAAPRRVLRQLQPHKKSF